MKIKTLSPHLSVSAQIQPSDMESIVSQGFKVIINNRPDNESDDQPPSAIIASEAERHELVYFDIPVVAGELSDADVKAFADAMQEMRGPVLAYCRTGTRSAMLWALYAAERLDIEVILQTAKDAGYDLKGLAPRLRKVSASGTAESSPLDRVK